MFVLWACRQNGEALQDFDVLTLCDTGAQWYTDVSEREQLEVERRLREPLVSTCSPVAVRNDFSQL